MPLAALLWQNNTDQWRCALVQRFQAKFLRGQLSLKRCRPSGEPVEGAFKRRRSVFDAIWISSALPHTDTLPSVRGYLGLSFHAGWTITSAPRLPHSLCLPGFTSRDDIGSINTGVFAGVSSSIWIQPDYIPAGLACLRKRPDCGNVFLWIFYPCLRS